MAGITIAQYAQVAKDPLAKFMALKLLRESKMLSYLPFENVTNLKVAAQWWEVLPTGGAWRMLNEGYTSAEDGQLGDGAESLFFFGGDLTFDRMLEKFTDTVKDPIQLQIEGRLKSMTLDLNDAFINGDPATNAKMMTGIKKRVANLATRQTVYFAASNAAGLDVTASAGNVRSFFNKLEEMWQYCNGNDVNLAICNESFILGFGRACRYAQTMGSMWDTTKDTLGREFKTWRGVPLVDIGFKKDQSTEIILNTETGGDSNANTTSLYLLSINTDDGVYGIQNGSMTPYDPLNGGEMEAKPSKMRRIDWALGLANFGRYCLVRGRNVKAPSSWTE